MHAWIYSLHNGHIRALNTGIESTEDIVSGYRNALAACWERAHG